MSVQNCHCGECPPFGACCYEGENTDNVAYEALGNRNTDVEIEFQYSLTDENNIKSLLGFGTGEINVAIDSLKVKCDPNAINNNNTNQGIYITFLTERDANTYEDWVFNTTGGAAGSEDTNRMVMRVKVTDGSSNSNVGDTLYYEFASLSSSFNPNVVRLLSINLFAGDRFPNFAILGLNLWGNNPDISIYPKGLYDESGCTYTQQIPCIARPNSTCWIEEKECNVCPAKGGSTVDDCGCWIDNPDDGVDDLSVCNANCGGAILDTCGSTNNTQFEATFFDSLNSEQLGFIVGTQAPYKDAPYPEQCGIWPECTSTNLCDPQGSSCFLPNSVGENDLKWSDGQVGSSCTAINFSAVAGVFKKYIRMCSVAGDGGGGIGLTGLGNDVCGECCSCNDTSSYNPCSETGNPFNESLENTMPKKWQPLYSTVTIPSDRFIFERGAFINKLEAKVWDGTKATSIFIPITNSDYPDGSPARELAGVWKGGTVKGHPGDDGGDDDEKAFVFMNDDWARMDTNWQMKTYCLQDIETVFGLNNAGYTTLFQQYALNEAWYTEIMNTEDPVFLRIWTGANRSVVADHTLDIGQGNCCVDSDQGNTEYRLDMEYANDSQTERELTTPSCENDGCSCRWSNPWRVALSCESTQGYNNTACSATYNASGAKLTNEPATGDFRYPLIPHEYGVELWYIGERDTICATSSEPRGYPTNFRFIGAINEVVNCSKVRLPDYACGLNGVNDTCQTFYHQAHVTRPREKIKIAYVMPDDGTAEPWNGPLSLLNCANNDSLTEPCNWHGLDDSTLTRKITLAPNNTGFKNKTLDDPTLLDKDIVDGDSNPLIPELNPPAVADPLWKNGGETQEQDWYHADPKHDFGKFAMGRPQAIGRFTELPFVNVADKFLDSEQTIPGFYLTVTAFHMDGIDKVEFYLDGGTMGDGGTAVISKEVHPLEVSYAKIKRDTTGKYDTGLREYTVKIPTSSLSTGVHEVRAKVYPSVNTEGKVGVERFIYGEPPTGGAGILLEGQTSSGRVAGEYLDYGPIAGKNWPVSQAQWPQDVPDGPIIENGKVNFNPMAGAEHRFNLANAGFSYQATEGGSPNDTSYPSDRYIFGATNQQKLIQNGYESYWFNYNPSKTHVYVGTILPATAPSGSSLVSTIWEAFVLLKDIYSTGGVLNAAQQDAEIILQEGTEASPTEYWWPNVFRNPTGAHDTESFSSGNGFASSWCPNTTSKKSIVIRGENPESKDKTKILMPPGSDRAEFALSEFSLHIKDLTVMTSLMGHNSVNQRPLSGLGCFAASGDSCRLVVENVLLNSKCANNIPASALLDGSGNVICGDTRQRDSSGNLTGGLTYVNCPPPASTSSVLPCAADTTLCSSNCCGATSDDGLNCTDCTTSGCSACGEVCGCRVYGTTWWPFISKDSVDLQTDTFRSNLLPAITCGDGTCDASSSFSCKGIFSDKIATTSPYMCLGTNPEDCINMGKWNQDLMGLGSGNDWTLGAYGKYVESKNTVGPTVTASAFIKHMKASAASVDLITNQTHAYVADVYVFGSDSMSQPSGAHNDFVQWTNNAPQWWKPVKKPDGTSIVDYGEPYESIGDEYPRKIQNFNVVVENRIITNIKLTSHFGRIIHWPAPSLTARDSLADPASDFKRNDWGHPSNFGQFTLRNLAITDFHYEDIGGTVQQISVPMNHYYIDNWVTTACHPNMSCASTDDPSDSCVASSLEPRGRTPLGRVNTGNLKVAGADYALHYGKKVITNLHITNFAVDRLNGTKLGWDPDGITLGTKGPDNEYPFGCSFDYGPNSAGKMGSNFLIVLPTSADDSSPGKTSVPYYWTGSHTPVFKNIRQVRNWETDGLCIGGANQTGGDAHLTTANVKATNITGGPIVILSRTPKAGRTSSGGEILNEFSKDPSSSKFKADRNAMTAEQLRIWRPDATTDRLNAVVPRTAKTYITSSTYLTKDNLAVVTSSFDKPSAAHCDLLDKGDNITKYGIPNVGAIDLNIANTVQYYHSVCSWSSAGCGRSGPVDERKHPESMNTVIMQESGGVRSWVDNPSAGCFGQCLERRDHYFVDYDSDSVDLTWCPVINECICSDV